MKRTFLLFIMILLPICSVVGQGAAEKRQQQFEKTKKLVDGRQFRFEAVNVKPRLGASISLVTTTNRLEIKNDSVQAYLPYFGELRIAQYNGEGAIQMNDLLKAYEVRVKENKRRLEIQFSADGPTGLQQVMMQVNGSGWTTVLVRSMARPSISYYGKLKPLLNAGTSE